MAFLLQMFPLSSPYLDGTGNLLIESLKKLQSENYNRVVIQGPDRADKTSLVFQACVSVAATGGHVTYICTHALKRLPHLVHGMSAPEPKIMKNVDFLYYDDVADLVTFCSSVHLKAKFPRLIIVEDILSYAVQLNENNQEKSLAKLCALLSDTQSWVKDHSGEEACSIILTAPARISSMKNVLRQFDFKLAVYRGPERNAKTSSLSVNSDKSTLCVNFERRTDSLFMTDVDAQYTHNTEPTEG